MELVKFIKEFGYDISYWIYYSNHENTIGNTYEDIYENPDFQVCCFNLEDVIKISKIKTRESENYKLEKNKLYSIEISFVDSESHYLILITTNDKVYVLNMYGGRKVLTMTEHKFEDFEILWNQITRELYKNYDKKEMSEILEMIMGFKGIFGPYYIEDIDIKIIDDIDIQQYDMIKGIVSTLTYITKLNFYVIPIRFSDLMININNFYIKILLRIVYNDYTTTVSYKLSLNI